MTAIYDDPATIAALVADLSTPVLLGFDVDGVLAPIVRHSDESRLLDGVNALLARLATGGRWRVAVVSGRSLGDLDRFRFPPEVSVVGSHGMETVGATLELTPAERARLDRLAELAHIAVDAAGPGARAETKPASIAVHIREADDDDGGRALEQLSDHVTDVAGATTIVGLEVLELFARTAGKGEALRSLRERFSAASVVFVGDDVTDEHAFAALGPDDVGIKVGDAATIAAHRLRDPEAVLAWLEALRDLT
jgi:trehalose 6-phosphate phosphatase